MTKLANLLDSCKPDTTDAEPDMLIIHCPRVIQTIPWCDWAADTLSYLASCGWIERREHNCVHIITPLHPAMVQ